MLGRRDLLMAGLGGGVALAGLTSPFGLSAAFADVPGDKRFVFIVLRGAMDGLNVVVPYGDASYRNLRRELAMAAPGETGGVSNLDGFFGLHPKLTQLSAWYQEKALLPIQAVATAYRDRSHFDGQDVLESGLTRPGGDTGWLNRALLSLQPGERVRGKDAFAVGPITPLLARGPAPVLSWTPSRLQPASNDTLSRLLDLYQHTDPGLAKALQERTALAAIASGGMQAPEGRPARPVLAYFNEAASGAARFMARPDGPRVGALAFDGWSVPK